MNACEYSAMITGIACTISKDKSKEELALIVSMLYQLGRSIETIAIYGVCCKSKEETTKEETTKEETTKEETTKEETAKDQCSIEKEKIYEADAKK